ncbi:GH36-type glycosyl hydrolase domain-containing protein [Anatilimnocola floriformis]|uniref:GH36-type glycosyl hydrolase domain-containing protein n=1 Tax=Anatilimnocola floriformis TaxID=2948575 RepID=UPI0020C1F188|nr:glucoamylase family protein [Anatilimnocola floriformis]
MSTAPTCPEQPANPAAPGNSLLHPLRGEAFSSEHLELHFRDVAARIELATDETLPSRDFARRFELNATHIATTHAAMIDAASRGDAVPAEAEWLLDNYYVVEEQLREIRDDLPRGYYQELPKTKSGHPRVYELARELVIHTDSSLDDALVARCLKQFQSVATLTIGEVWAVPIMLRLVLVENLRRLCDQLLLSYRCHQSARSMLDGWEADKPFEIAEESEPHCFPTIIQLLEQIPDLGASHRSAAGILERQIAARGWNPTDLVRQEHQRQAANQVSIGNVITSMRLIAALDWSSFFEDNNQAEQVLRQDPAGVYPQMHFNSRDQYRHVVEELAKRTKRSDVEIAEIAIDCALAARVANDDVARRGHVGYWLVDAGRRQLEVQIGHRAPLHRNLRYAMLRHPNITYFGILGLLTLLGVVSIASIGWSLGVPVGILTLLTLLWILPASELAQSASNLLITNLVPPRILPRFDFKAGVPQNYPTIVVVPSMLTSNGEVDSLLSRLESHYLSNGDEAFTFALLTDFADAAEEVLPGDAALVERAAQGIRTLNHRYQASGRAPFYLFHRRRKWNPAEGTWMGWERKRGKLMEFGRLLHGEAETSYVVQEGDLAALARFHDPAYTPFVITLDSDTQLPHDSARKLVGTLAHPLNRPKFAADHATVTAGYTILQPRVNVHLAGAGRSWFARIFAGSPGVDPYTTAASDTYQDLFGEGSFTGKGIYDLQAFERALGDAFPENAILSHDLIEGCHTRVGLVSNIEVYDGYPARYDAEAKRAHRWVRGDWQLLPWLLPYVPYAAGWKRNPLSLLSRWKVFDNLRRSAMPIALFAALLLGWFLAPQAAWAWTLIACVIMLFPLLSQAAFAVRNWPAKTAASEHLRAITPDLLKTLVQCGLALASLPHKAWSMVDAISRTLVRMLITRRHLLEWETAAAVESRVAASRWTLLWNLAWLPILAILLAILLPWPAKLAAAPLLVLWCAAPGILWYLSQPLRVERSECTPQQHAWLREIASDTWAFFEAFVGPGDHWLPVDNVQEEPEEKVAHRLSPTNEGLYLLSALIARDFGLTGLHAVTTVWENNLQNLQRLEKLNGHFFNWYDTETLQPLPPRYVSTVDSGNLAACLLTLHAGIDELHRAPILQAEHRQGIVDSLELLIHACTALPADAPNDLRQWSQQLQAAAESLQAALPAALNDGNSWQQAILLLEHFLKNQPEAPARHATNDAAQLLIRKASLVRARLQGICQDVETLFPWQSQLAEVAQRKDWQSISEKLHGTRSLAEIAALPQAVESQLQQLEKANGDASNGVRLNQLREKLQLGAQAAKDLQQRLTTLSTLVERLALDMDFKFLYNPARRLFSIGFNIEDGRLDRSHYDMLCSEARLASYLAIAKGDVPANHWFHLGRHATISAGQFALLSWGGTMFEYLMPPLFQRQFEGSLLTQSCRTAVLRQQEYGRQNNVPWGISESAFGALAVNSDYHYRSFGVPGLGLKRGLAKDLVISPYSTLMALIVDPAAAAENLQHLADAGAYGEWGFYDALDYTPERVPFGKQRIVVRCFMAHHQGMGMLALGNLLNSGCIQRRFNAHPMARAAELLLQERVPTVMTPFEAHADEVDKKPIVGEEQQLVSRRVMGVESPLPRTHLLSNGKYSVLLSSCGGGFSRAEGLDVTRWRSDRARDHWGQFIYLRELDEDLVWSPTYQPTRVAPDHYEVIFAIDKVDFHRRQGEIETQLEVAVSPENKAEVRQLRITNHSHRARRIEVTSYAEVVLAPAAADLSHAAFQKLFVETEYIAEETALLARRRPRDMQQPAQYAVHVLATPATGASNISFESSRAAFLGRGRSTQNPQAVSQRLTGTSGAVLDPIMSLRCTVEIPPGESIVVAFSTAVAASREEAMVLADQYHELRHVQRVFELAWAYSQVELRHQHLNPGQVHQYQRLASFLLYPHPSLRGDVEIIAQNRLGQSGLWRHGISGDLPILLAHVTEPEHIDLVRDLALAQRFWRERGFRADLVIINDYPGSYIDALQDQMVALMQELNSTADKPSVFLLRGAHLPAEEQQLFETAAACVLRGEHGSLSQQLDAANQLAAETATYARDNNGAIIIRPAPPVDAAKTQSLEFWNGVGGFAEDGKEYRICVRGDERPPMPWSHVVANEKLGFLITEAGGGYSWFANSRENKLTTWSNDPVEDCPAEVLYVQDETTGQIWTPMISSPSATTWAHYGAGYARFTQANDGLQQETTLSIDQTEPVKIVRVKLTNNSSKPRSLRVSYFAEWVLGVVREQTHLHLRTDFDAGTQAVLCRNPFHPDYPNQVAFLKVLGSSSGYTADRAGFLGRHGSWAAPAGLNADELDRRTGTVLDPCAVVQSALQLAPRQTVEITFLLGSGDDEADARRILAKFNSPESAATAVRQNIEQWQKILTAVQVKTPNRSLDLLMNQWLLYQVLCCRMWARSAFYQSGGAYGFRDQLQDSMAVVYSRPDLMREHLLRAAARQYRAGDVQHWWHPPHGKGTRTRFSDDLLWLPLAVGHYVRVTGDDQVLAETVTFLDSPPLQPHEHERYEQPKVSNESASLYEHCLRTIDRGLQFGAHGLPLMGCGDWNDGMNKVGEGGKGESVWVGWFLLVVMDEFLPLMRERGDVTKATEYEATMRELRRALELHCWDGEWYRRAYFDDGSPLGSKQNDECQIDSLAQTWAVFAGGDPERARKGMQSAVKRLVDRQHGLVLLFEPPFDKGAMDPGYIKGYLPGIRENGGQYTHAATWMIQALAELGEADQALSLLDLINPILHADSPDKVARYQVEPYVLAADVYGAAPHQGRGGWTWYTGSASWLYRVILEKMLGLQATADGLSLAPHAPEMWAGFEITVQHNGGKQTLTWPNSAERKESPSLTSQVR